MPTCSLLVASVVITMVLKSMPTLDNSVDTPASMELSSHIFSTYYSLVSHSNIASSLTLLQALTLHPLFDTTAVTHKRKHTHTQLGHFEMLAVVSLKLQSHFKKKVTSL